MKRVEVLTQPEIPVSLSGNVHWLSGEGCGSWFQIEAQGTGFMINRFSPDGRLECKGIFKQTAGTPFNINEHFEFTYLSHCAEVNLLQYNNRLTFKLVTKST